MNMAYEIATFRRPSMMVKNPDAERAAAGTPQSNSSHLAPPSTSETPTTPIPPEIDIDDEFNLPISVAVFVLLTYIIIGAKIYSSWEDWGFFEAFYFVFISMSTIGFGDFVPKNPIFMMATIIYLIFGLALTSMCINVIQTKLSDSFKQASAKMSSIIGLKLAEEEAKNSQNLTPIAENVSVHSNSNSYSVRPEPNFKLDNKDNESFKFNYHNNDSGTYDNAEVKGGRIMSPLAIETGKQENFANQNNGDKNTTDKQNKKENKKSNKK